MIQFNLTPVSGVIILSGKYSYDQSLTEDEYREALADFQIELTWDSDMLMNTSIRRIIWLDPIPFDDARKGEERIRDAYQRLSKKPIVLMRDNLNDTV